MGVCAWLGNLRSERQCDCVHTSRSILFTEQMYMFKICFKCMQNMLTTNVVQYRAMHNTEKKTVNLEIFVCNFFTDCPRIIIKKL